MVGFCGRIGVSDAGIEPLAAALPGSDAERSVAYADDGLAVRVASHARFHEAQPATAADGSLLWVYGEPFGFDGADGYQPRTDRSTTDADYCADLYDEHGLDFVAGLNGEFAGLVFDRRGGEAHLFTDRLGTRPLFYGRTEGALLFSTRLQSIGLHPEVTPSFDRGYLAEFFGVQKAFGTATPLSGVRTVAPASILAVGLDGAVRASRTYWRPAYRPVDRSPAELAAAIASTVRQVFAERVRADREYGVMLSGGSDSRLLLGATSELGRTPTAFHMTNWLSREARTAERVAAVAGVDFRLLRRGPDYHERLLELVPPSSNFVGAFDESIASGFAADLDEVDVLVTGYLGDTMFGRYPLYLPLAARVLHPRFERRGGSASEYVERYLDRYASPVERPGFLDAPAVADVMRRHITAEDGSVQHHGVTYPSLRELQLCEYYPLTNQFAYANTDSLRRITGHWSPFFDHRLIDLSLSIPVRDRIRYDPINLAVTELAPSLAAIPHGSTGVRLDRSGRTGATYALRRAGASAKRRLTGDRPPAPYLDHGPWMDERELIRSRDFVGAALDRHEDRIAALPFLDVDGVRACHRDHLDGADNWRSLYTLVTLLETPVAERVAAESR